MVRAGAQQTAGPPAARKDDNKTNGILRWKAGKKGKEKAVSTRWAETAFSYL